MVVYSNAIPVRFNDPLPEAVDVVVIGAGVIGICTALFLAKAGASVFVCEKGRVAGEQSSRNWGWIRQQRRDAAELPIMIDSINTWEALAPELTDDIHFTRQGTLYLAETAEQMAGHEAWLETARQHQLDTRLLSGKEVDKLINDKRGQWQGALYTPSDGRAEPFKAVPALAQRLKNLGGGIRENCAVRSLDIQGGKLAGVVTEAGRIRANSVVCAGGAWSSLFLGNQGIHLPQLTVRATVARTAKAPEIFMGNASAVDVSIRRRQDGGYTVAASDTNEHYIGQDSFRHFFKYQPALKQSKAYIKLRWGGGLVKRMLPTRHWRADERTPFELNRVLNPAPSASALLRMKVGLNKRFPRLAGIRIEESWAGMIDVTPDVVPVIDQVASLPGLFIGTGFSGHGFGIGPGAGRVLADLVQGNPINYDLSRFRFSRFSDGSKMQPGPGL